MKRETSTGNGNNFDVCSKRMSCWRNCIPVNMSPRLKVSDFIVQRLEKLDEGSVGFLLGILDNDLIYALGITRQLTSNDTKNCEPQELNDYDLVSNLPANINYCGVFNVVTGKQMEDSIINNLWKKMEGIPAVLSFDLSSKTLNSYFYEDGAQKKIEHVVVKGNDLLKSFLHLRLTSTIPLSCDFRTESIQEAFKFIHEKVKNGSSAFHILGSDIYILGDQPNDVSGISSDATLEKLYSAVQNISDKKIDAGINFLNVGFYLKGTNNDKSPQLAPLIKYVKKIYKHVGIKLIIDTLCIASNQLKIEKVYPILVESACRNLELIKQSLMSQLDCTELRKISVPETYHFFPPNCGHFVSVVYPAKQTSEQLKKTRENFHLLLSLPVDKPLFRRANAFDFSQAEDKNLMNLILNPHEGLPRSGVPDGEVCVVQGTYAYHHYMQNKIDDNGWGCAYRSLQTIFSWFRFQGYTNMPVPTHKEIQQCLVNIGDKPSSFVGSKQWIGSTEVSFVLDTMLGVTCRIVNISSGEEMLVKGGELSYHFKTQGTPVMIGGGVLAHTILGVDYNKKTGAIKFLILDPHYSGSEDLKIIQSKGWCGWKGPEFWKKDAFYNMCLPQRPKCV